MIIEVGLLQNFFLAFLLSICIITVVLLIVKRVFKSKKQQALHEDNRVKNEEKEISSSYKDIIKTARKNAKTLLKETSIAAGDILTGSKQTNEYINEQLDKVLQSIAAKDIHSLKSATDEHDKVYQKHLEEIDQQLSQSTKTLIDTMQKTYDQRLGEFTNDLLKKGSATESAVDKKTAELITQAEAEIAEYKKMKLSKVDEEINNLVEKVYKDVLRMSIPQNLHKELIIKSLEEAKKDEMFKL